MDLKKTVKTLALGLMITGLVNVQAAEYEIDPSHSDAVFRVKYMGLSTVSGRFEKFSGSFTLDTSNVLATKGSAVIDANSINTNETKRDGHLRSEDFFHVEKHPEIKFVSKSVKAKGKDGYQLIGDLTMRGVTKEIALDVKPGGLGKDPWGNTRAAFEASGKINRKDWGLQWNKALEAGGLLVGEDVTLDLSFQGVQKAAATPAKADAKAAEKAVPAKAAEKAAPAKVEEKKAEEKPAPAKKK